ncbi:substrate binding domain-containing protein [Bradyrhizobium sp. UFLA01-814]|uniref:substrate binding domain-containing protein n=1 Tax=Bradyrhizobium sp. UFLA01-814 TaxID=3023480 RepID=UPI00398B5A7F
MIDNHRIVAASPTYLDRRGPPATPEDLASHDCLLYNRSAQVYWRLVHGDGRAVEVEASSRLRSDNGEAAHDWTLDGAGLIMKSWVDVAPDLASGRLVRVLPEWRSDPAPVCALFSQNRQMPTRVRLFLNALSKRMITLSD